VKSKAKLNFLITAGPTREHIDPVRFISNASSGKMGYSLAAAAAALGHKVTLISSVTDLRSPAGTEVVSVKSARQMFEEVKNNFLKCDCLIMAAAVADYTPAKTYKNKMKKSNTDLVIHLKPTADILKWAGKNKKNQIVVGFALEDKNLRRNAEKKLRDKKTDIIIANSPEAIGENKSTVHIKTAKSEWIQLPEAAKTTLAKKIIKLIETVE
jgi:phosphopantothenoylcysteine synthetase/decarboxylase